MKHFVQNDNDEVGVVYWKVALKYLLQQYYDSRDGYM